MYLATQIEHFTRQFHGARLVIPAAVDHFEFELPTPSAFMLTRPAPLSALSESGQSLFPSEMPQRLPQLSQTSGAPPSSFTAQARIDAHGLYTKFQFPIVETPHIKSVINVWEEWHVNAERKPSIFDFNREYGVSWK